MKQILLFLFCTFTMFLVEAQVTPINPCTGVNVSAVDGTNFTLGLTKASTGGGASRIIVAKKGSAVTATPTDGNDYQHNTVFTTGYQILPDEYVVYDGTGTSSINISNLEPNTTYHFAVYEYNGTGASIKYLKTPFVFSAATASTPIKQATNITFPEVDANHAKISWEVPSGAGERHLVVIKAGAPVDATVTPVDLISYSGNAYFTYGHQFPTGNYVVYKDNGTAVTVSNLLANTTYHVAIYEYNGNSKPVYLSANPVRSSFTTAARPLKFVTGLFHLEPDGNRVNVRWDQNSGSGIGHMIVAKEGSAVTGTPVDGQLYNTPSPTTSFGSGPQMTPGEFVLYKGTGYNVDALNLKSGTTYYFKVFEYANGSNGHVYAWEGAPSVSVTMPSAPTVQASDLTISEVTNNSLKLSWKNGNGKGRIILGKKGGPVNAIPKDFSNYPSSRSFGNVNAAGIIKGSDNTDNYVVFASSLYTSETIISLESATDYHFAIFEYNGSVFPVFNTTDPSRANHVTASRPSLGTSALKFDEAYREGNSLRLSWTNGNGTGRIVVARKAVAVANKPVDYTTYSVAPFGATGQEWVPGSGEYVVFNATGSSSGCTVSGLEIGTTYHFAIFEYAGTGSTREYLTTQNFYATGTQVTHSAPTAGPKDLKFDNITNTSIRLSWTNAASGGGTARLVLAREGEAIDFVPVNLTKYSVSTNFAFAPIGSTGVSGISFGNRTDVTVANLKPGVTYHFKIVEANGDNAPVYYNGAPLIGSQTTTVSPPTAASTTFNSDNLESNSVTVKWNSSTGTGAKRIVIASEAPVSAVPVNGTVYTQESAFGNGVPIKAGEFVIYNGSGTQAPVTNLQPGRTYYFRVYEYNEFNGTPYYLTTSFLNGTITTKAKPAQQASNLMFSALAGTTVTLSWTAVATDNYLVIARAGQPVTFTPEDLVKYNANASFGSSTSLANGHYILYSNNANNVNVTGLTSGTTYYFSVFAFNGTNGPSYNNGLTGLNSGSITTLGAPATQSSNIEFSTYSNGTLQLSWSIGSGNRRIVLAKEGAAVNALPVNNKDYIASSFFKSGDELGTGNYVVYNGSGSGTSVSGLDNRKTYHFAIYEYNQFGPSSNSYLTLSPATKELVATAPLPVNWVAFSGALTGSQVRLEWITAQETNNSGYEVERSSNGISFMKIGAVVPNSTFIYKYIDAQPLQGIAYYRIKQLDQDGTTSYSKTIKVQSVDKSSLVRLLQSPVQGQLKLQSSQELLGGKLHIFDAEGREVHTLSITATLQVVNLPFLKKGIYYLRVADNGREKQITLPFIKD